MDDAWKERTKQGMPCAVGKVMSVIEVGVAAVGDGGRVVNEKECGCGKEDEGGKLANCVRELEYLYPRQCHSNGCLTVKQTPQVRERSQEELDFFGEGGSGERVLGRVERTP